MHRFLLFTLALCFCSVMYAQNFEKGDIVVSASVGFPHLYKSITRLNTQTDAFKKSFRGTIHVNYVQGTNPFLFRYEYGLGKDFSLGFCFGFYNVRLSITDTYTVGTRLVEDVYKYKLGSLSFGLRPNVHLPVKSQKSDLYIGCGLGITKNTVSLDFITTQNGFAQRGYYEGGSKPAFYIAPTIGFRRYLSANAGLNLEAGFDKGALFQAGILFRFRPTNYDYVTDVNAYKKKKK